ncbi:hypothetical protein [Arthrobacter sp. efr-133-TYG-104]|uniref:hypothetical protein n=1 Tax=Arthrobacter sp. efr-133-TYG-104 TaxID=3040324 RepID=UPI00254DD2D8|nr:hypothetical protein [Arthrobacter sp. efr-133-TYG-104]
MNVKGEYRLQRISRQMLVSTGLQLGVTADLAEDIVGSISGHMVEAFDAANDELRRRMGSLPKVANDVVANVRKLPLVQSTHKE